MNDEAKKPEAQPEAAANPVKKDVVVQVEVLGVRGGTKWPR